MRIRTIKPEFFTHEGLFEAEASTGLPIRIAFAGLWCVADREGRFKWEPRRIGVQILPYDGIDFSRVMDALTTRGFIIKYRVNDAWFGCIPSFGKHQVINNRESASNLPECSANDAFFEEIDALTTRESREDHAGKGEGKGREGERKEGDSTPQAKLDPESDSLRSRINKWFSRRENTEWSDKELKALKSVVKLNTPESDLQLLDARYESKNKYRRKDILTLLNNWNTEIDRCKSGDDDSQQSLPIQSNGSYKLDEDIRSYL
jgi:hypothetical protein